MTKQEYYLNEITFQCKINNVPECDTIWINLLTLNESELAKIANELNIKPYEE